jgi:hypothetical protein
MGSLAVEVRLGLLLAVRWLGSRFRLSETGDGESMVPFGRRSRDVAGHTGGGGCWLSTVAGSWVAVDGVEGGDVEREGKIGGKKFGGRKKMAEAFNKCWI